VVTTEEDVGHLFARELGQPGALGLEHLGRHLADLGEDGEGGLAGMARLKLERETSSKRATGRLTATGKTIAVTSPVCVQFSAAE